MTKRHLKRISPSILTSVYFIVATVIVAFLIFPIYWMIISSFKGQAEIFAIHPTLFPQEPTLDAYVKQFTRTGSGVPLIKSISNSFIISSLTTIITTLLSVPAAYGLARFNYKINKPVLLMILLTQMLPTILFLAPLYIILKQIGLMGTYTAPAVFVTLHSIPFSVLMLRPYFLNIPKELESSAIIDGCNKVTAFIRIMLPLTYPGIVVVIALSFLWGWGDLMGSLTFINSAPMQPLTQNMFRAMSSESIDWSMLMSFATVIVIPAICIFLALQKFIITGLTAGAVKG